MKPRTSATYIGSQRQGAAAAPKPRRRSPVPLPAAIGLACAAVAGLCFAGYRTLRGGAAHGDVRSVADQVAATRPKDAPALPSNLNPARGAVNWGKAMKRTSTG